MQFYIYLAKKTDLLMKVIIKCANIKLWDILGCFHNILNAPRIDTKSMEKSISQNSGCQSNFLYNDLFLSFMKGVN